MRTNDKCHIAASMLPGGKERRGCRSFGQKTVFPVLHDANHLPCHNEPSPSATRRPMHRELPNILRANVSFTIATFGALALSCHVKSRPATKRVCAVCK